MFIPSVPSLPSRPHPIKVVRESLDSFEGIPKSSPITTEAFRQTFPETPQAFTPLFSANIGTPGVPTLPSSSVGTSGTPLSTVHTRGKFRRDISKFAITRATSLYTRKTPSSSNRTRMSPIISASGTPPSPEVRKANDVRKSSRFEAQQSQAATNLLTASLSTPGNVSSPPPPSPRRNSDPAGRASRDLETFADRVELPEEVSPSTLEVKEPDTQPSESVPSQRFTLAPQEKSPSPNAGRPSVFAENESRLPTPDLQDKDGDNVSVDSRSRLSTRGSTQSDDDQVRCPAPKQRPRPLDLPVVNSDIGAVMKQPDGSSGSHQGQECARSTAQMDTTPKTGTIPDVSADTIAPVVTPVQVSPVPHIRSSKASEQLSPLLPSLGSPPSSRPSPSPSLQSTTNVSTTSSPVPSSESSPPRSSTINLTPTPSRSQVQNASPVLPSSTLVSPTQHDRLNSLGVPSFASFLRQSYADLTAVHPPPPYQTAILSQAIPINGENEPHAGSSSSLPSYIHTPSHRQGGGLQPAQCTQLPQAQAQWCATNFAPVSEGAVRLRAGSVSDTRMPRSRPLGPRKPSGSQGQIKVSSLESYRLRAGSLSSVHPNLLRSGVGFGDPPTSRKLSTASIRGRSAPRFPTVPVRWRGYTLDVARWTFTSQQLQEIASRAIEASAESYYVRLLKLETLDAELPEELHRLELLTTDLKTRIRATVSARRELLDALTTHASGTRTFGHHDLERIVEELGAVTHLTDELNDELYTVADQIAQLKRLRDVHSSSALAMSLRKLNTSLLRQATENQLLRERVATLEAERDIAWAQAEHVAQEFDDLSAKLEQGVTSTPSSTNNSRRASRVSAVRKSSIRVSKSGLRHSPVDKINPRASNRSSSISSFIQPSEAVPPVPPIPNIQDPGSGVSQHPRHRPSFIQTVNLPEQFTPGTLTSFESGAPGLKRFVTAGLYSITPNTETRAMAQAQRELCEMLGINLEDLGPLKSRPRSMSQGSRSNGLAAARLVRRNSDVKPRTSRRYSQHCRDYFLSPYDVSPRIVQVLEHILTPRSSGNLPWLISHCWIDSRITYLHPLRNSVRLHHICLFTVLIYSAHSMYPSSMYSRTLYIYLFFKRGGNEPLNGFILMNEIRGSKSTNASAALHKLKANPNSIESM